MCGGAGVLRLWLPVTAVHRSGGLFGSTADGRLVKSAVILAGGYATRFGGRDKAVAPVAGTPMIRRVVDAVGPLVDDVVVNARTDQQAAINDALDGCRFDYRYAFDAVPDRGPLYGIATGLAVVETEYALVVACDMPFVNPRFVEHLFERAVGHDAAIPVERTDGGEWLQPLQAVYRAETMARVASVALEDGLESPQSAIAGLDYVTVQATDVPDHLGGWTLRNVNTRAELVEAERRLADGDASPRSRPDPQDE